MSSSDGSGVFLPPDHPLVRSWAEPAERFLPPVDGVNFSEDLNMPDATLRSEGASDVNLQLVLTTHRIIVMMNDQLREGSIRWSDVGGAEIIEPPGQSGDRPQLVVQVRSNTPEGLVLARWLMQRKQAHELMNSVFLLAHGLMT